MFVPLTGTAERQRSPERGPRGVAVIFKAHRNLFLIVAGAVLAAVILLTFLQTPRYTATASVLIDPRRQEVTKEETVLSGLPVESSVVDTEVQVLQSPALVARVIRGLDLQNDSEFVDPGFAKRTSADRIQNEAIRNILEELVIRRSGLTYVIDIRFRSRDPAKAARIANSFAEQYLVEQVEAKFKATQKATKMLEQRLGALRAQVQHAERAVSDYRAAHGLMSAVGSSLTEQELSNLNQQLALAQAAQAESQAQYDTAVGQRRNDATGGDVSRALSSEVIRDLRAQRATVSRTATNLEARYGPRHPQLILAKKELADINAQIQGELNRITSNVNAQAIIAHKRTASIEGSIARTKAELASNNSASVRLNELERNAASVRAIYESYLNRFRETSTQEGTETTDARIVSAATVPDRRSSPNIAINLILGAFAAMLAGAGAVFIRSRYDTGIGSEDEVEQMLDLPCFGSIPMIDSTESRGLAPVRCVIEKPLSTFSESFRLIRSTLVQSQPSDGGQVVALTSATPDEGKTTTTLCLGRTMALAGDTVVIVDVDLRHRSVSRELGLSPRAGLLEVLSGTVRLEQALVHDTASGAWILPLTSAEATAADPLSTGRMNQLLSELRRRFTVVLLDCAPVLPVADTRIIAQKADLVLFLVRWRHVPRPHVHAALQILSRVRAEPAGVVLTQVDLSARSAYGQPYFTAYQSYHKN